MTIVPLDGGLRFISTSERDFTRLQIQSQTMRRIFGLDPQKTEWETGRPIYDRLPRASEAYRKDPQDKGYGKVFLDGVNSLSTGEGSLKVELTTNNNLFINSGKTSWEERVTEHFPVNIDISSLGLERGNWYIGYEFINISSEERTFTYKIENQNLSDLEIWETSSPTENCGFESEYAIFDYSDKFFLASSGEFTINLLYNSNFSKIVVPTQLTEIPNEEVYLTSNLGAGRIFPSFNTETGELIWDNLGLINPSSLTFKIPVESKVSDCRFTGIIEAISRPEDLFDRTSLVIYNSEDPEVLENKLNLLAFFRTNNSGNISDIIDIRKITTKKNEPVAKWLTEFQDENLLNYYNQINNYQEFWMNPETAGEFLYGTI